MVNNRKQAKKKEIVTLPSAFTIALGKVTMRWRLETNLPSINTLALSEDLAIAECKCSGTR